MQRGWSGGSEGPRMGENLSLQAAEGPRGAQPGQPPFELPQVGAPPMAAPSTSGVPQLARSGVSGGRDAGALTPALSSGYARAATATPGDPARASAPQSSAPLARTPTLTQQMRTMQPPDVARQAMSELGVLARELATLPELLEVSGLARTHRRGYFEATQAYLGLARQAWESVAEERLEQSGAEPEYRQRAIAVARRVGQMQQECRAASDNEHFPLPRKSPLLWSRRVALVGKGLRAWQARLAPTPDPREMGTGLFLLRGYLGLANAGTLDLLLLDLLTSGALVLLGLLGAGLLILLGGTLAGGSELPVAGVAGAALATALVWGLLLLLAVRGPVPLGVLLGAAVFSPGRTSRHGQPGAPFVAGLLRAWWLLTGIVGAVALLFGLGLGGALVGVREPFPPVADVAQGAALAGSLLTLTTLPAATASLGALVLLALPVLFVTMLRFAAEVAGSPSWVPGARRYALPPALTLLAPLTCLTLVGAWLGSDAAGWQQITFAGLAVGGMRLALTLRSLLVLLALALPYLLLLDLPYRIGMLRWRRAWLGDLSARRADVESHVRRLSVSDPRSGAQDTSEENLRAMQYDLVLLQFYRDKIAEAEHTPSAPFTLAGSVIALAVAVVGAAALDSLGTALVGLLVTVH